MQETCEKPLIFFALSAFFAAKNGDGMAAKDAKVAKTWGRGLSAFALSAA